VCLGGGEEQPYLSSRADRRIHDVIVRCCPLTGGRWCTDTSREMIKWTVNDGNENV